jgi:ElaB/YqjD/DUF883 family membrane-anchored ribosome-binding protein
MLRSELLEREAEARRLELAQTFDELRARATPGRILDQLVDYATDSGGVDFFRNLRDQTVSNPLALGLVGAGLAWLMMSNVRDGRRPYEPYDPYASPPPRSRMRSYLASTRERAGSAMSDVRERMAGAAHRATGAAGSAAGSVAATVRGARDATLETASLLRDAAGTVRDTAGTAASSLRDATTSTYEQSRSRVGDTTTALGSAASSAASTVYGGVAQSAGWTASGVRTLASGTAATSRDLADFCRDQPLVMVGLGVALGAAMGAAFPSTEKERQLMGDASDDFREQTRSFAAEHYEKTRSKAETVLDEVQNRFGEGSAQSATSPGDAPPGEEITEIKETPFRPERIGLLRDERH